MAKDRLLKQCSVVSVPVLNSNHTGSARPWTEKAPPDVEEQAQQAERFVVRTHKKPPHWY